VNKTAIDERLQPIVD